MNENESMEASPSVLYGDDPLTVIRGSKGRGELVSRLVRSLNLMSTRTDSSVIALVGPWGSGKSTLLNAVDANLSNSGYWKIARYNPWSYSSLDSAVHGFFSELSAALPDGEQEKETRKKVGSWVSSIAPVAGLTSMVTGNDPSAALDALGRLIVGGDSPEKRRAKVTKALEQLETPVLMLIDDLDRLGPDELLMTFKLVRMLGRLPNVFYLLCYDEATLIDVLKRTGLVDNDNGRARAYLEKMIQLRLDIPSMLDADQIDLVNTVLAEVQENHQFHIRPAVLERFSSMWKECIRFYLTQPRAIKRLFTQVDAAFAELNEEVDFADFVAMTFLRTFEPAVFSVIERHEDELLGRYVAADPLGKETSEDKRQRWLGYLVGGRATHPERILDLLALLFLPLGSSKYGQQYGAESRIDISRRCGVGHSDYFYRYTQLGIPRDDLPNSKVAEALRQLQNDVHGQAVTEMQGFLVRNPAMVIGKISRHDLKDLPVAPLLLMFSEVYGAIGNEGAGIHAGPPSYEMLGLARQICATLSAVDASKVLRASMDTTSGLSFITDVIRELTRHDGKIQAPPWLPQLKTEAASAIEAHLRRLSPSAADDDIERSLRCIWALRDFTTPEHTKAFLWDLMDSDGRWDISTFIALLLPIGYGSDGMWMIDVLGLSAGQIDDLLGFDRVATAMEAFDQSIEPPGIFNYRRRPTLAERKVHVVTAFSRLAADYESAAR